ncbi:MAG TPA: hypothetical protein VLH56_09680, partial [Dissulfurispiraceae bacterium]|nr:hypothetical protein [Dissulfurispiraceae bacterium]
QEKAARQKAMDDRITDIWELIGKRLNVIPTDELWNLICSYKYEDELIVRHKTLSASDIANIIISMYPKATSTVDTGVKMIQKCRFENVPPVV